MRPDSIERRRRPRILTLPNVGKLCVALLIAFLAITIRSEMRGNRTREYGRLVGRQIDRNVPQKPPVNVVHETPPPIDDQPVPDPMLVEPMARQQWLHDSAATLEPMPAQVIAPRAGDSDLVVVGGPEGVRIVRHERRKPVLSGGFGRP
ncbi:MAG TPA: hypothetical protein VNA69_23350 [Thermoanaerobaculia bacterium]|nr:hypothetical protein [Thermoanaerobaculia bacterium]